MKLEYPCMPIRVMLVDDHEHVLWGLTKLVNGERPRMEVAGTGRTVIDTVICLRYWKPDVLVISDVLAGESSVARLRDFLESWRTSILVLTDSRDPEIRASALKNGAQAVLVKGDCAEQLLWEIEALGSYATGHDPDTRRMEAPPGGAVRGAW